MPEPDHTLLALLTKAGVVYHGRRANPRGRLPPPGAVSKPRLEAEARQCRVEGRLFLAFAAAILHILLENRMHDAGLIKLRSVAEVLALLRKIKRVHFESGNCRVLEIPKRLANYLRP